MDWFGIHENLEQSLSQLRQVCKDYGIELKVNPSNFKEALLTQLSRRELRSI
jgi:hypothetical protein